MLIYKCTIFIYTIYAYYSCTLLMFTYPVRICCTIYMYNFHVHYCSITNFLTRIFPRLDPSVGKSGPRKNDTCHACSNDIQTK